MKKLKLPIKEIDKTVEEIKGALYEDDSNQWSDCRICDAWLVVFLCETLKQNDPFALDVYYSKEFGNLCEFLDDKICLYMENWAARVMEGNG